MNRKISRRMVLTGLVTATAGLAAACVAPPAAPAPAASSKTEAQPTAAPATGEKTKVTLSMWTHDNLYVQFFGNRAKEWKDKHPEHEFTFDFQQVPEVFTKMLASLAANEPVPDLFGIEQGAFPNFMKGGIIDEKFVDLTELIGGERKNFAEGRWTPYMSKGKLYGVDSSLCACGFYYQPEVFKKVGLEKFPETWDDLMTAGKQAAKDGVALSAMDGEASSIFYLLYLQRGGTAFDKDGNFVLKDSPNKDMAIEVLNFLKEGVDNKVIYAATNADFWGQGLMAAYGQGKVAGVPGADWYSDFILKANAKDMSGKWRLAKLPKWKSGGHSASVWGGTGFAITKASKNPQLAWDLLHYSYMTKENQIKRFEEIKYSPHMLDAINDPRVTDVKDPYFGDQQTGKVWAEVAGDLPFLYQSPVRGDMEKALGTAVTNVVAGKAKAEDALNEVISITQKAIQDL